jgi:hypothetical protein
MAIDKKSVLRGRDSEDLAMYAQKFRALATKAQSLEAQSQGSEEPTTPKWCTSFSQGSESALARGIWTRLSAASEFYKPAETVLLALHDPAAILYEGKTSLTEEELARAREDPNFKVRGKLDSGARLAVYPCTWTADEARLWRDQALDRRACDQMAKALASFHAGKRKGGRVRIDPLEKNAPFVTLDGRRPVDLIANMAAAKQRARGAEALLWARMDEEALLLVEASIRAWNETPSHRAKGGARPRTDRLSRAA